MIVLNPYQELQWNGEGPHPHSVISGALTSLYAEKQSQSIIISGESGMQS